MKNPLAQATALESAAAVQVTEVALATGVHASGGGMGCVGWGTHFGQYALSISSLKPV